MKAQFNKLNCADKNWKKQVGYTAQQYNNREHPDGLVRH